MVAGIGLVRDEPDQERRRQGSVCVDRDVATQATLVVVERRPGLVGDVVELHLLAVGQADKPLGAGAQVGPERLDDSRELVARERVPVAPGLVALSERAIAGERLLEDFVDGFEALFRHAFGRDAVAPLDLVDERDLLARKAARDGLETKQLGAQPVPALFLEPVEVLDQRGRVAGDVGRREELLGVHALLDLRRAEVRVDETVDVAAEPEAELEVALRDVAHVRSNSAAWPWPTPTQSVASP